VRVSTSGAAFFQSDPDYEPFGIRWLRGLTPARVGLVAAVCLLFTLTRSTHGLVDDPWAQGLPIMEFWATQILLWFPVVVLITAADNLSEGMPAPKRIAALAAAVMVGAVMYTAMYWPLTYPPSGNLPHWWLRVGIAYFFRVAVWAGLLTAVLYYLKRERQMADAAQRARLERIALEGQMAEAHLQMLQAQIEPHFLFNSLANIKGLFRSDAAKARRMIGDLALYLRAALPQMRETASTLRRELALATAYLRVVQVRMGERLKVEIAVPEVLQDALVPPMMLPTLIENAVKHGIAPLPRGGIVRISAARAGDRLRIAVADDGAGFLKSYGPGVGLANCRARLATLYGSEGVLRIAANTDNGVTATIEIPLQLNHEARRAA
jgi:signal transduction histidine kinase